MKTRYILIFFVLMGLFSCETLIDIRVPESERKIVMSGKLSPDSLVVVSLLKSTNAADTIRLVFIPVEDGLVQLFEDDRLIGNLEYLPREQNWLQGFYRLPGFYPVAGKTYRLEATSGELAPVSAETIILPPVTPESIEISSESGTISWDDLYIKVKLKDPAAEENFYGFSVKSTHKRYDGQTHQLTDSLVTRQMGVNLVDVNDAVGNMNLIDVSTEARIGGALLFSDELYNGKEYSLKFDLSTFEYSRIDTAWLDISFEHISKSYYLFGSSYGKSRMFAGGSFMEPISVYTNVEHGLGILASGNAIHRRLMVVFNN